jgi:uncharacterized protein YjiK
LLIELPYNLSEPQNRYLLPSELAEVSGLSYYQEGQLAMVQDERGRIYLYDMPQQAVVRTIDFALPGDFEGIEWTGTQFYALRSDGVLFRVDSSQSEGPNLKLLKTFLNDDDDVEGLGYRPDTRQLLLACKEPRGHDRYREIYTYDLKDQALLPNPLNIDLAEVKAVWTASARTQEARQELADFDIMKKKSFKPSAIAVHPLSGHYYVLASSGKLMVVINSDGHVLATHYLPRVPFSQPEGLCFGPDGDLYLSNEGRDGDATLLHFRYLPHD